MGLAWLGALALVGCGEDVTSSVQEDGDDTLEGAEDGDDDEDEEVTEPPPEDPAPEDPGPLPQGIRIAVNVITGDVEEGDGAPLYPARIDIVELLDGELHDTPLLDVPVVVSEDGVGSLASPTVRAGASWIAVTQRMASDVGLDEMAWAFDVAGAPVETEDRLALPPDAVDAPFLTPFVVGEHLALSASGALHLFDLEDADRETLTEDGVFTTTVGADSLLYLDKADPDEPIVLATIGDGVETRELTAPEHGNVGGLFLAEDESRVVWTESGDDGSRLVFAALDDPAATPSLAVEDAGFMLLQGLSPSGQHAYVYNGEGTNHTGAFVDLDTGATVDTASTVSFTWSRDGEWVALATDAMAARAIRLTDGETFSHLTPGYDVQVLETCGDGYVVDYGDGAGWFAFAEESEMISLAESDLRSAKCSPDHRWLAWQVVEGDVYVAPVTADGPGERDRVAVSLGGPTRSLGWSNDGSTLVYERCGEDTGSRLDPCDSTITAFVPERGEKITLFEGRTDGFNLLPLE